MPFSSHLSTTPMHRISTRFAMAVGLLVTCAAISHAQGSQPAAATPPAPSPFSFSGVIMGNYQYHTESNASTNPNGSFNKFELERAYLTFQGPAGNDRTSFRVTADVFQNTSPTNSAYYAGWVVRLKYAYLQYDYLKAANVSAFARAGIVHTPVIDHEENFWPRWIAQTALERAGYFSSADGGVATQVNLPNKVGQLYATITNGPGYASREVDRFKDYSARLTLTPLANSDLGIIKTLDISPWIYKGALASKFVSGGAGQIGPVGNALTRERYGLFAAVKNPGLTVGGDWAQRIDSYEAGANTLVSPRVASDSTGRLLSGFIVTKPAVLFGAKTSPLGLVARYDHIKPVNESAPSYHVAIAGLTFDLSSKAAFSLDYQEELGKDGSTRAPLKTYYAHFVVNY